MERNSNPNNTIKLSILDIFPSYEEINPKKEEMFAIFQGLNNFFDLEEILTRNKTKIIEIENNNQSSIIISLIKSNNIIATGFINIKHGEQWITLNYETKNRKISSSLALNLMDCIKLKIFCDLKNKSQTNTTFNNININNSGLNINANINYTNRNNNKGANNIINQINLKISKRNINNKILLKGSPMKTNYDRTSNKRSPNKDINDFNTYKIASNEDIINNNLIKSNNNFNTYNYMNVNINMNPYTTISKCSIKKIDLNSSNKTRNSKIAQKKGSHADYTSLRTSNNNFGIKKMNTSTCSLNTVNKNKNKKSRLTPDLEVKGVKNTKVGCSPGPSLKNKKNLDDNLYNKSDNTEKANDKTFHYSTKIKNFRIKETNKKDNKKEDNNINIQKKVNNKSTNYSNNIVNAIGNINEKIYSNKENNKFNDNKYKIINENNYNSAFNNTFNNINKHVIKNKLLYTNKQNSNKNNIINNHSTNIIKKTNDIEGSITSFDEEDENKTKENNIINKEKIGIYTTKRIKIKKNRSKNISPKYDKKENMLLQNNKIKSEEKESIKNNNNINEKKEENKEIKNEEKKIADNNNNNENIEEDNIYEDNEYERIKEDFILLYNDNYTNNIQDDLLKLEIELFIEKLAELISIYHYELEQKRMENKLINNEYNINIYLYKKINKLIKKLELYKIDYEIKNKKSNKKSIQKEDKINLIVNKTEIELFKNILPENKNKEKINKLKNIIVNILKKEQNRNILSNNEKFNKWINNLYNKINEKDNNTLLKNNSYYNLDNTYKKKMLISPLYPKNNKFIHSTELAVSK